MLTFPDMLHLLANKFACLRGCSLTLTLIGARAFFRSFFWHLNLLPAQDAICLPSTVKIKPLSRKCTRGRPT